MKQGDKTKVFYNQYGRREWERLDKSAYDKLNMILHMDFIKSSLVSGKKLIDVGCGAGRFSVEFTRLMLNVTLFDISDQQLILAKEMITEYGNASNLNEVVEGSIADMSTIENDKYDITVCYGAPLNYLFNDYRTGISELYRITKPGGEIFISVNSRLGVVRGLMGREKFDIVNFMGKPDYWFIDKVIDTGDLPEHPEVNHPPRHFFNSSEISELFREVGFKDVQLGSSPSLMCGLNNTAEKLILDEDAWDTTVQLELKTYMDEGLSNSGEFILLRGRKPLYSV